MNDDYENLRNQGYQEEPLIVDGVEMVSKVGVSPFPMGSNREDRATHLTDSKGAEMRNSSIMMGYNRSGIQFPNGDYISKEEFEAVLTRAVESIPDEKIIVCKKTGKTVQKQEVFNNILELTKEAASLSLGTPNSQIKNQETSTLSIKGEKLESTIRKGVLMLGNGRIQMPRGEYLSLEELEAAIRAHVLMSKEEPSTIKVVKRKKTKWNLWPIIVAGIMAITMGFKVAPRQEAKYDNLTSEQLEYIVNYIEQHSEYKSEEEMVKELIHELDIGEKVQVSEGVKYYAASDDVVYYPDSYSTFGQGPRDSGEYNIDYISIIKDGEISKVERKSGANIGDTIDKYCQDNNVSPADVTIMLHLGGPVAGWVDLEDVMNNTKFNLGLSSVVLEEKEEYKGTLEDFEGKITIDVDGKSVDINLLDENGNLVSEDSIIIGSDGQQYRVSRLQITEVTKNVETSPATKTQISWSIHNITKEEALFASAVALAGTLLLRKKEETITEATEDEYVEIVEEFKEEHKDDFIIDRDSKFLNLINKINTKQPNWRAMSITWATPKFDFGVIDDRISEVYSVDEEGKKL